MRRSFRNLSSPNPWRKDHVDRPEQLSGQYVHVEGWPPLGAHGIQGLVPLVTLASSIACSRVSTSEVLESCPRIAGCIATKQATVKGTRNAPYMVALFSPPTDSSSSARGVCFPASSHCAPRLAALRGFEEHETARKENLTPRVLRRNRHLERRAAGNNPGKSPAQSLAPAQSPSSKVLSLSNGASYVFQRRETGQKISTLLIRTASMRPMWAR